MKDLAQTSKDLGSPCKGTPKGETEGREQAWGRKMKKSWKVWEAAHWCGHLAGSVLHGIGDAWGTW